MLRDRHFKAVYRSEADSLLDDFYVPALLEASRYDRAVGFFSATMLSYAAQGISALAARGGRMRLIFGGDIEQDESSAIEDGYMQKQLIARMGANFVAVLENVAESLTHRRLEALAWLVASGLLDIKVALKPRGMYHEKIGIIYDDSGDRVVFQGSANETVYALVPDFNFESINVFQSWRPEHEEYAIPYVQGFERLWDNKSSGTLVIPFPEAALQRLLTIGSQLKAPRPEIELRVAARLKADRVQEGPLAGLPVVPTVHNGGAFELRPHQTQALNAWKANEFCGVLSMATGSGKTITALYGLTKIFEAFQQLFVVVSVPYQSLADQWVEEFRDFGVNAIPCYAGRGQWEDDLRRSITIYESGALPFVACVVVNRTLQSETFRSLTGLVTGARFLFIGDECHYFGSEALHNALPKHAQLRLGLSATPTHYLDVVRNDRVRSYFGRVCFTYCLADALRDKVLTPYRYYVHPIELNEDETERYLELSRKISRLAAGRNADTLEESEDSGLEFLLFQRARLLGNAAGKLLSLRNLIEGETPSSYTLFYCGDGTVEDDDPALSRQIDQVSKMLYQSGWRVSHFTAREARAEKQRILGLFRIGALDGLVAMKCLDEGIDVPACRTAYILASSRNPRQFIQRRGRILRRSAGKAVAIIHDFLPFLPSGTGRPPELVERALVIGELKRVAEFASLAMNPADAINELRPTLKKYDLYHHVVSADPQ
jgi:superfamily II DNA or RNA helicase